MQLVELNEKEYKEFTKNNKAHFLQSYEWGEVSHLRKNKVYYLGLKDDDKIVASALVLEKKLYSKYTYFYIPRGYTIDYHNKELLKIFTNEMIKFAHEHHAIYFKIDPAIKLHTIDENANIIEGPNNYDIVKNIESVGFKHLKLTNYFETNQPRFTFRIPLVGSIEEIENKYTNTTKARIKKALDSEVFVDIGNQDDVKEFSRLMELTEKRQDFYSHSSEFFNNFYKIFKKSNMVTLYLGKINLLKLKTKLDKNIKELEDEFNSLKNIDSKKANGRKKEIEKNINSIKSQLEFLKDKPLKTIVVSSYLIVKYNDFAWALYAANDMDYKTIYANYLVYQKQIRDSYNEGYKFFDVFGTIGNPNAENKLIGLHDFKKKWGGEYTEFIGEFDYILNPILYFMYKRIAPIKHKIANKKLRKGVKK